MPQAVVAIGASVAGGVVANAIGATTFAGLFAGALTATSVGFVGSKVFGLDEFPFEDVLGNRASAIQINPQGNAQTIFVPYGRVRYAGVRVGTDTFGTENRTLQLVYAFADGGHPLAPDTDMIEGMWQLWFDNQKAGDDPFRIGTASRGVELFLEVYGLGRDNQNQANRNASPRYRNDNDPDAGDGYVRVQTDPAFMWGPPDWRRFQGVAYALLHLQMPVGTTTVPWAGLPTVTYEVQGRKVWDPRDPNQSSSDPATWTWSDNPWLCILDYLMSERYGRGVPVSRIDVDSFMAEASYCDELVVVQSDTAGIQYREEKRFTLNGLVDPAKALNRNLVEMLSCCRGAILRSGGVLVAYSDRPRDPEPEVFDERHVIGAMEISLGGIEGRFNKVTAHFISPDKKWQPDEVIIEDAELRAFDGGELLAGEIDLPFTIKRSEADRLTGLHLKRSRDQLRVGLLGTMEWLDVRVGSVIHFTHRIPGWTEKLFTVMRQVYVAEGQVKVELLEYDPLNFEFADYSDDETADDTDLPNPSTIGSPSSLSVTVSGVWVRAENGVNRGEMVAEWAAVDDGFLDAYILQWRLIIPIVSQPWQEQILNRDTTTYTIPNAWELDDYEIRVRAKNVIGALSEWRTVTFTMPEGPKPIWPVPESVSVSASGRKLRFAWTPPADVLAGGIHVIEKSEQQIPGSPPWSLSELIGWLTTASVYSFDATVGAADIIFDAEPGEERWFWFAYTPTVTDDPFDSGQDINRIWYPAVFGAGVPVVSAGGFNFAAPAGIVIKGLGNLPPAGPFGFAFDWDVPIDPEIETLRVYMSASPVIRPPYNFATFYTDVYDFPAGDGHAEISGYENNLRRYFWFQFVGSPAGEQSPYTPGRYAHGIAAVS